MTEINIGTTLQYDVRQKTIFLFKIAAGRTPNQRVIHEQFNVTPDSEIENCQIGDEGNHLHRLIVEPCQFSVHYQATVELTHEIERPTDIDESRAADMPADVLTYLNPSRYCESDLLGRFAFEEFGNMKQGFGRVQAICDWVHGHLDYTPGSTNATTTAADVLLQRTGVCRDYAHLAITLCRGIGIPARYISGYAVDLQPPDFHGFMEAFLDDQWYLFDPTRLASTVGLVRIGVGRDAADVAFSTLTGSAVLTQKDVWASYSDASPSVDQAAAVSIS